MKLQALFVSSFLVATAFAVGCSSSSSGGSNGTPGVFCSASLAGAELCYGYTNLTSDEQNSLSNACTQTLAGKVVSSCPTASLLGCCKTSTAGSYSTETCYYGDDSGTSSSSFGQQSCTSQSGTWSTSQ